MTKQLFEMTDDELLAHSGWTEAGSQLIVTTIVTRV